MNITVAYDCTHSNIGKAPRGLLAGYTTGSGGVQWTGDDWLAHPGAVRICQDNGLTDATADVADVETGAGTVAHVGDWAHRALASYRDAVRPGQRSPLVYCNLSTVTPVANALVSAGLANGSIGLFVAEWSVPQSAAVAELLAATGPFPLRGTQIADEGLFDLDLFSSTWLAEVSAHRPGNGTPTVWGLHTTRVTVAEMTVQWSYAGGTGRWQVHLTGPGFDRTVTVSHPEAVYGGLRAASVYDFSVVSIGTDGRPAGTVGKHSFRTAA